MGRDFPEFSPEKLVQNSHGDSQILSSLSHIFLPSFTRHKLEPFKLVGIFFFEHMLCIGRAYIYHPIYLLQPPCEVDGTVIIPT